MKNLRNLLLALALAVAAILSTPKTAQACDHECWCNMCIDTGECYICCRCQNRPTSYCLALCG